MVGGRGNVSLPFCVDWHHFGAISGTCVPVHQNHGHTTPCFQMETFFSVPIRFRWVVLHLQLTQPNHLVRQKRPMQIHSTYFSWMVPSCNWESTPIFHILWAVIIFNIGCKICEVARKIRKSTLCHIQRPFQSRHCKWGPMNKDATIAKMRKKILILFSFFAGYSDKELNILETF